MTRFRTNPAPIIHRPILDFYRAGYEAIRTGCAPVSVHTFDEDDREMYERGKVFARSAMAVGYVLEDWPAGRFRPPHRATAAALKAQSAPVPSTPSPPAVSPERTR